MSEPQLMRTNIPPEHWGWGIGDIVHLPYRSPEEVKATDRLRKKLGLGPVVVNPPIVAQKILSVTEYESEWYVASVPVELDELGNELPA